MKDLQWIYMLDVLAGEKFSNFGLQKMAEVNCGQVVNSQVYTKLSDRLYIPSSMDKFMEK